MFAQLAAALTTLPGGILYSPCFQAGVCFSDLLLVPCLGRIWVFPLVEGGPPVQVKPAWELHLRFQMCNLSVQGALPSRAD